MKQYLQIVDRNRATRWMRFFNFFIDRVIFSLFFFGLGILAVFIDQLLGIYYFTEVLEKLSDVSRFMDFFITSVLFFFYTFLLEYFTNGRTIGKYITGTQVIAIDGKKPTLQEYFIRNISRIVPFDGLSFFGENGWHDSWSDTRVIIIKNYQQQLNTKDDIDSIGTKEIA